MRRLRADPSYREKENERKRKRYPAYYQKNKIRINQQNDKWYQANRPKMLAYRRKWGKDNSPAYRRANPEQGMLDHARERARKKGLPFSITRQDISIPELCPLLQTPLYRGKGKLCPNSPTLDRLIPALGYVPRNVLVISHRANQIKNDATLQELKDLTKNLEKILTARLHTWKGNMNEGQENS